MKIGANRRLVVEEMLPIGSPMHLCDAAQRIRRGVHNEPVMTRTSEKTVLRHTSQVVLKKLTAVQFNQVFPGPCIESGGVRRKENELRGEQNKRKELILMIIS